VSAAAAVARTLPPASPRTLIAGRTFLHPSFDYLLIGGGLSLVLAAVIALRARAGAPAPPAGVTLTAALPMLIFVCNMAHFAASTVRLYTREGARARDPFLTMAFPIVSLLLLGLAIAFPQHLGAHLNALYFTWSPYHYSAQAYGLAAMYCYRSACPLGDRDKWWLRLACLPPFLLAFLSFPGSGIEWLVAPATILDHPSLHAARQLARGVLIAATFVAPLALVARFRLQRRSLPAISLLVILANGVWWTALPYLDAFVWVTVFHGVQYLAIVSIFHVNERMKRPDNRTPGWRHAASFYALCLTLGYALFQVLPLGYEALGFGWAASSTLVVAAINVHHFIVDAYIWRLRKDPNYRVVEAAV
jgi:hypothetical protein